MLGYQALNLFHNAKKNELNEILLVLKKSSVQTNYFFKVTFTWVTFIYFPDTVTQINLINEDLTV